MTEQEMTEQLDQETSKETEIEAPALPKTEDELLKIIVMHVQRRDDLEGAMSEKISALEKIYTMSTLIKERDDLIAFIKKYGAQNIAEAIQSVKSDKKRIYVKDVMSILHSNIPSVPA